jgi:hypothetical protein
MSRTKRDRNADSARVHVDADTGGTSQVLHRLPHVLHPYRAPRRPHPGVREPAARLAEEVPWPLDIYSQLQACGDCAGSTGRLSGPQFYQYRPAGPDGDIRVYWCS